MGCVFSRLAAKFAFFPPSPPTYLVNRRDDGKLMVAPSPDSSTATTRRFPPHGDDLQVWLLDTKRGNKIVAFFLPNPYARLTLLYSHGNATDLGQLYHLFLQLKLNLRVNIMGYDYSGYGASTGEPSESNTYADIEAAYECLQTEYGVSQEDIILYGQSVGSGPTLHLAAKLPRLRAVVLHSGILSGLRVLCHERFNCCCDIYKNIKKIPKVKCHVLVIHGTEDEVVNWVHGHRLWRMAREAYEPLWVKGGGHSNLEVYPDYIRHLSAFVIHLEKMTTRFRLQAIRQTLAPPGCTCCCCTCSCSCTSTCTSRCCWGGDGCCCCGERRWVCGKWGWWRPRWPECKCSSCLGCRRCPTSGLPVWWWWWCCCCSSMAAATGRGRG